MRGVARELMNGAEDGFGRRLWVCGVGWVGLKHFNQAFYAKFLGVFIHRLGYAVGVENQGLPTLERVGALLEGEARP